MSKKRPILNEYFVLTLRHLDFPDDVIRVILSIILAIERSTQNRLLYEIKLCVETEDYQEIMQKLACLERLLAFCPCSVSEWEGCQNGIAGALGKKRSELRVVESKYDELLKKSQDATATECSTLEANATSTATEAALSPTQMQQQCALLKEYSQRLARELISACQVAIDHTEMWLATEKGQDDALFHTLLTLKLADYYRYCCEGAKKGTEDWRRFLAEAEKRYEIAYARVGDKSLRHASKESDASILYPTAQNSPEKEIIRWLYMKLRVVLQFCVFLYEQRGAKEDVARACLIGKEAFDEMIASLETYAEVITDMMYKDITILMPLLRDNLTLWSTEVEEKKSDAEKEDSK